MSEEDIAETAEDTTEEPVTEDIAEQPEETTDQPISVDDLASEMGWKPQDKWRGEPDKWRPAHEYLRDTVDINRSLKNTVANMARTSAELTERAVAAERDRVLAERQEAFATGDAEAFDAADVKLRELGQRPQTPPREVEEFAARNASWFNKDDDATRWAVNRSQQLAEQGIRSHARQIEIVEREAKSMFPEFFQEVAKPKPAPLNKPGNRGGPARAKGFADMPKEAQDAAKRFADRGRVSVDDYVKTYFQMQQEGA